MTKLRILALLLLVATIASTVTATGQTSGEERSQMDQKQLVRKVLTKLNLHQENAGVYYEFLVVKPMPYDKNKSVMVVPKVSANEEAITLNFSDMDLETLFLDAYILIVDNTTAEILSTFYEEKAWYSDAMELSYIEIDFAPYKLNSQDRAFAIRTYHGTCGRVNQYTYTEISLFVANGQSLVRVLEPYEIDTFQGERFEFANKNESESTKTVLIMSEHKTNGYFDIIVKNKTLYTKEFIEDGEEKSDQSVSTKTTMLKFDSKQYR